MHRRITLALCVCLFVIGCSTASYKNGERQFNRQKMDDYLALLSEHNKAILSLEIVEKGKTTYQSQTGFAYYDSTGNKVKADAQSQYRVGSITKIFTATLIMQLIEQGQISLNTPLSDFYPEIKNATDITIDQMLRHRSGLANYTAQPDFYEYHFQPQSKAQMVALFEDFEPVFSPDRKHSYSNTNYLLLGFIIEEINDASYKTVLQKNIIEPLNLKRTGVGSAIETEKNQAQSFYYSHSDWQIQPPWDLSVAGAAGAIISTPHDLNIFIRALMSGKLVNESSLKKMLSRGFGYGRGIIRMPFFERYTHGHYGKIDGFSTVLLYFPEDDMSVAVTVNGLALDFNDDIVVPVLSIYYNINFPLPNYDYEIVEIDPEILQTYVGDYRHQSARNPDFTIDTRFYIKESQLFGTIPDPSNPRDKTLEVALIATGDNSFYNAAEGVEVIFKKSEDGSIDPDRFKAIYNGNEYYFRRK